MTTSLESRSYVGDVGTVVLVETNADLSAATSCKLMVRKPNVAEPVEWTATDDDTKVRYVIQSGDLDAPGDYLIQPLVTLPSGTWRGETFTWTIYEAFA